MRNGGNAMLGNLIRSIWHRISGSRAPDDNLMQAQLRTALSALMREPLAHPKTIDYEMVAHLMAAASSADYMVRHMMSAQNLVRSRALLEFALGQCSIEGLVMEFGVYRGDSLRAIAQRLTQPVHGFDSFEGLPQDWTYYQKRGRFSLQGQVPHFDEPNIRVHKGWFDQILPRFLADHPEPARFVHIDCDIYASTRAVLDLLQPRIVKGTIIVFDEYLNYPGWREHEYKAFQEYVAAHRLSYRYLGFASSDFAVAIVVD